MQPIDPAYTFNTFLEADRVRDQLRAGLKTRAVAAEFRYQGSVTSDTHIRVHSDIDLLALHGAFFTLEPPLTPLVPYIGEPLEDLRSLRTLSAEILISAFPAAHLDQSRGKALGLQGGSLRRKVDVVIGNWWTTLDYNSSNSETYRGVHVYDAKGHTRVANKPFLHNDAINNRDAATQGGLRKTIRLLKSLKYDADKGVPLSSYDITSIAYRMPDDYLTIPKGHELRLVVNSESFLRFLIDNPGYRNQLRVPNELRPIFGSGNATEEGLRLMCAEVARLRYDIENGLARSFKKLAEARIQY
jgi:hypothetical protein